jgi:hypothetical protein
MAKHKHQIGDSDARLVARDQDGMSWNYVDSVGTKLRVSAMPYGYDIAEGNIEGHSAWVKLGYNGDVDAGSGSTDGEKGSSGRENCNASAAGVGSWRGISDEPGFSSYNGHKG